MATICYDYTKFTVTFVDMSVSVDNGGTKIFTLDVVGCRHNFATLPNNLKFTDILKFIKYFKTKNMSHVYLINFGS